jgi:hypothetical protein
VSQDNACQRHLVVRAHEEPTAALVRRRSAHVATHAVSTALATRAIDVNMRWRLLALPWHITGSAACYVTRHNELTHPFHNINKASLAIDPAHTDGGRVSRLCACAVFTCVVVRAALTARRCAPPQADKRKVLRTSRDHQFAIALVGKYTLQRLRDEALHAKILIVQITTKSRCEGTSHLSVRLLCLQMPMLPCT